MSEVEIHQGSALALSEDQAEFTQQQIAGLRQLGIDRASKGDLDVFFHVSQRTGLDPFARQIYLIERQGKQTIQTGIDGFRLVARRAVNRTGESLSIGDPEWADQNGTWSEIWVGRTPPAAARVVVMRDGQRYAGVALYAEYVQRKRDGDPMAQWGTRPAGMLAKCAEALALRKAFPQDLSAVYSDDEMMQAENQRAHAERQAGRTTATQVTTGRDKARAKAAAARPLDPRSELAAALFIALDADGCDPAPAARLARINDMLGTDYDTPGKVTELDAQTIVDTLHTDEGPVEVVPDGDVTVEDPPAEVDPTDGNDPWFKS